MAYKNGTKVVVVYEDKKYEATVVARMNRQEYQVRLPNGNAVHVQKDKIKRLK